MKRLCTNPLPFSAPSRACTDRSTQKIGARSYDQTRDQSVYHGPEGRGQSRRLDLPPQWGQLSARVCHVRATACSLQHTARTTCRTVVRDAANTARPRRASLAPVILNRERIRPGLTTQAGLSRKLGPCLPKKTRPIAPACERPRHRPRGTGHAPYRGRGGRAGAAVTANSAFTN